MSILMTEAATKPSQSRRRLTGVAVQAIVSSPLERCVQTAQLIAKEHDLTVATDVRLIECGYGDWTGQEINKLTKDPLWKVVQAHPSAVTFPGEGGEAMRDAQVRAVDAVRSWNAELGPDATWLACSHADIIKAVVADALGMHLDTFQRIVIDPCSITVINYTSLRARSSSASTTPEPISATLLKPPAKGRGRRAKSSSSDAVVGGGAGAK